MVENAAVIERSANLQSYIDRRLTFSWTSVRGVNGSFSCKEQVSQANPVVEEPASASQDQGINHSGDGSMETSEQYKTRSGRVIRRPLRFKTVFNICEHWTSTVLTFPGDHSDSRTMLSILNINCFQFSQIALMLGYSLQNPFSLCCLYFCLLFFFGGESCNDQRYFPTHACIGISAWASAMFVVVEIKTVLNPQLS